MFITHLRRFVQAKALCALACTLAFAAFAAPVLAGSYDQEGSYSSRGNPAITSALAQERYYASYPGPEKRTVPQAANQGNALLVIALSIGGTALLAAAGLAGHHQTKRRRRGAHV